MKRSILAFIVGLVVWVLVASLLNRVLRLALEGYAAAEPQIRKHARHYDHDHEERNEWPMADSPIR